MQITPHEIHIWTADLTLTQTEESKKFELLSADERERANRFHFPIHKQRFIAARSQLREILHLYLAIPPQDIIFSYDEHHKPHLQHSDSIPLQFNLSHSEHIAVFAFTLHHAIGIDIEKIQDDFNFAVAQRYFSKEENTALMQLPSQEKNAAFYRIWARKEAIIKAVGKGLAIPLSTFSVSLSQHKEVITFDHQDWSLIPLSIHPEYESAVATNQTVKKICSWKFFGRSNGSQA
jgi:4'-phosphopantetheinyl transferase